MPNRPITDKERQAWKFARSAHKGQVRRFINQPYFEAHVKKVNAIVKQHTTDEDILCAAILHDVAEDCYDDIEVGLYEISNLFGKKVSAEFIEAIRQDFIPTNDNQDVGTIAEAINENEVRESLKGIKKICKNLSQKL